MINEQQLASWTGPSSATEQDKQERTERMVRDAIRNHPAFSGVDRGIYAKGSYANNTNVRSDSDVDVVVECREAIYWGEQNHANPGHAPAPSYTGVWTPEYLRAQVGAALIAKFGLAAISEGSAAFTVRSSSARVDADVVPCFTYQEYFPSGSYREGTKLFKKNGGTIVNYPKLQLANGRSKNNSTNGAFKKTVRIIKRLEHVMTDQNPSGDVPSYLLECLVYNCPNMALMRPTWREVVRGCLAHIFNNTMGPEPTSVNGRWLEVNEAKFLFGDHQKWTRASAHKFASDAWDFMGFE